MRTPQEHLPRAVRTARALTAGLLVAGACAVAAPAASAAPAAPGDLSYAGCLGNTALGCTALPSDPLDEPVGVAVSPDGRSLYAVSDGSGSVAHFFRDPTTGATSYDGCLSGDGARGCKELDGFPTEGARGVAVSPDGRSVYVVAVSSHAISRFRREQPDGQLVFEDCLASRPGVGCTDLDGAPLDGANGIAISPDGRSVYVTAAGSNTVAHFFRSSSDGELGYDGCLNDNGDHGCTKVPNGALRDPRGVAVSPDGRSVLVAARGSGAVVSLRRQPGGQLLWGQCVANNPSTGCDEVPAAPLTEPMSLAVSPDGRSVYVAAEGSHAVSHLSRDLTEHQLSWQGCFSSDGTESCADVPGKPLEQARSLLVTPDGTSVYAGARASEAISHLTRTVGDGGLTFAGCPAGAVGVGCTLLQQPAPRVLPEAMASSPDGRSVYVVTGQEHAIMHFRRSLDPDPDPEPAPAPAPQPEPVPATPPSGDGQAPDGSGPPLATTTDTGAGSAVRAVDRTPPQLSGLSVRTRRLRISGARVARSEVRATLRYAVTEASRVRIVVTRLGGHRAVRAGLTVPAFAKRGTNAVLLRGQRFTPGTYRVTLTATDGAGNRSRPASARFRVPRR